MSPSGPFRDTGRLAVKAASETLSSHPSTRRKPPYMEMIVAALVEASHPRPRPRLERDAVHSSRARVGFTRLTGPLTDTGRRDVASVAAHRRKRDLAVLEPGH
jgi:hypothetical protein